MTFPWLSIRNVFYFLYGLVASLAFLYLLFPADKFKEFAEFKATNILDDGSCTIGAISYRFPNVMRFDDVTVVSGQGGDVSVLNLEFLDVSVGGKRFWEEFHLESELHEGRAQSNLVVDWGTNEFKLNDVEIEEVDLSRWGKEDNLPKREVSGTFYFSGEYSGELSKPFGGEGNGTFALLDSKMKLVQPILALKSVELESVESDVKYVDGVIYFTDGIFIGPELAGDFSGVIKTVKPIVRSSLTIGGHLSPQPLFLQNHPREERLVERLLRRYKTDALPFQVGGTLQRPTFRFAT